MADHVCNVAFDVDEAIRIFQRRVAENPYDEFNVNTLMEMFVESCAAAVCYDDIGLSAFIRRRLRIEDPSTEPRETSQ